MSMMGGRLPQGLGEVGTKVASYPTYEAAQKTVSRLIAGEVPARDISIVGLGLRSIEKVTGRLGYASAARSGAINGVLLGLLFSAILVIGTPSVPIQAFVGVIFVGIAIGMLMSIVTYSLIRRRRDFASVMQVVADHYEVTVAASSIHRARQVLGGEAAEQPVVISQQGVASQPVTAAAPPVVAAPTGATPEPPRYGERTHPDTEPPRYGERVTPPVEKSGDTDEEARPESHKDQ